MDNEYKLVEELFNTKHSWMYHSIKLYEGDMHKAFGLIYNISTEMERVLSNFPTEFNPERHSQMDSNNKLSQKSITKE